MSADKTVHVDQRGSTIAALTVEMERLALRNRQIEDEVRNLDRELERNRALVRKLHEWREEVGATGSFTIKDY